MNDNLWMDKLAVIKDEIKTFLDRKEKILGDKFLYTTKELDYLAESIMRVQDDIETEYHNKWEEMKCEEQYQEKPE